MSQSGGDSPTFTEAKNSNMNMDPSKNPDINSDYGSLPSPTISLVGLFQQHHINPATSGTGLPLSRSPASQVSSPYSSLPSTPRNSYKSHAPPSFSLAPGELLFKYPPTRNATPYQTPPPTPPPTANGFFVNSRIMPPLSPCSSSFSTMLGNFPFPPPSNAVQHTMETSYEPREQNEETKCKQDENGLFADMVGAKAVVEEGGYISLSLRYDITVDICPNQGIRVVNNRKQITLSVSGRGTSMALVHPQGRVYQYNSRIEVQTKDQNLVRPLVKSAKMWPRGISFTSNCQALVYLVDEAGARSTSDSFHDLYYQNVADSIFNYSLMDLKNSYDPSQDMSPIDRSIEALERAEYERSEDTGLDCWIFGDIVITQTQDGLVSVERRYGRELFVLKTSPSNGKARLGNSFMYVTASMGQEAHLFVKSNDRRIHYNGSAFVVRNAGHSAGFDDDNKLRIW